MKPRGKSAPPQHFSRCWRYRTTTKAALWDVLVETLREHDLEGAALLDDIARRLRRLRARQASLNLRVPS